MEQVDTKRSTWAHGIIDTMKHAVDGYYHKR